MLPRPTAAVIVLLPGLARKSSWCCLGAIQSTLPHRPRIGRNKRRCKPGLRSYGEHGGLSEEAGTVPPLLSAASDLEVDAAATIRRAHSEGFRRAPASALADHRLEVQPQEIAKKKQAEALLVRALPLF